MHNVVVVGHVDHGKSTLLGRLLSETGQLKQDKIERVKSICASKGIALEPAFFLDALEEEQAQGISIDTTSIKFEHKGERFFLIDAPGHIDFLKNMASGASLADCGVIVVDAKEGIRAQTTRHLRILGILGVSKVIIAINKMDKVGYDKDVFDTTATAVQKTISDEGIECIASIPMVALHGENILDRSKNMPWYEGQVLLDVLFKLCTEKPEPSSSPFRMVLQDIYKFGDHRYFAGRVVSGMLPAGSDICFSPSGKLAKLESIDDWPNEGLKSAERGRSVGLRLADQLFVERGEVVSLADQQPHVDTQVMARLVWIGAVPFNPAQSYILKLGTKQVNCSIEIKKSVVDDEGTAQTANNKLEKGDFADVLLKASSPVAFDLSSASDALNKLVICTEHETVAAGLIDTRDTHLIRTITVNPNVHQERGFIEREQREKRQQHKAAVIWLTGLSGAGKSSLAKAIERDLFNQGKNVSVIDADNMRLGLCADLGFTPEDRSENVRRLAHLSKFLINAGSICIVAVISPYERDRQMAAQIIGQDDFLEVFVFCPLETCQKRDPKGLYERFAKGQVQSFTGFDQPYQIPKHPQLRVDSSSMSLDDEVALVMNMLKDKGII